MQFEILTLTVYKSYTTDCENGHIDRTNQGGIVGSGYYNTSLVEPSVNDQLVDGDFDESVYLYTL